MESFAGSISAGRTAIWPVRNLFPTLKSSSLSLLVPSRSSGAQEMFGGTGDNIQSVLVKMAPTHRVRSTKYSIQSFGMRTTRDGAFFKGKVVIVGASAQILHDFVPTPMELDTPGPALHLQAIAAAIDHEYLRNTARSVNLFLVCVRRHFGMDVYCAGQTSADISAGFAGGFGGLSRRGPPRLRSAGVC